MKRNKTNNTRIDHGLVSCVFNSVRNSNSSIRKITFRFGCFFCWLRNKKKKAQKPNTLQ